MVYIVMAYIVMGPSFGEHCDDWPCALPSRLAERQYSGHNDIGNNYVGHSYTCHNHTRNNSIGHNCHNHIGHNYIDHRSIGHNSMNMRYGNRLAERQHSP